MKQTTSKTFGLATPRGKTRVIGFMTNQFEATT